MQLVAERRALYVQHLTPTAPLITVFHKRNVQYMLLNDS
jgi:hypothetical protein